MTRSRRAVALTAVVLAAGAAASPAGAAVRWFHSPSGNIACEVASARPHLGTYAHCATATPPRSVELRLDGTSRVCRGVACIGNAPENSVVLRYGTAIRVGPFRCSSARDGIRCRVIRTGRGFLVSRERISRF
jgi:hypothetical protein